MEPTSVERPKAGRPSFIISDGAGFYFLPPLVPSRTFTGQFDPNLAPEVRIVCTGAVGPRCPTVRTMAAGVVARSEKYTATWKPTRAERNVELGPNKYRIEVYIGQQRLGFADLWFVTRNKDLSSVGSAYVGAVANQSLTINFRIESGIFPPNNAPVALDDDFQTDQGTPLNGNVLANDYDPDAGTVLSTILVAGPSNGTLTLNADGTFRYTPSAGFNGSDSFTYRASDGTLTSSVATVTITVNAVNTRPFFKRQVAGFQHTCALNASGLAYCWGDNNYAQLGNGTSGVVGSSTPVAVTGGHTFVRLAATCGLTAEGAAYCWGSNALGQLGDGTIGGLSGSPVAVTGGHIFVDLTAGANHTCGLTSTGAAYCWGGNTYGQL
jgi:VCBS repeat-containing protein